MEFKEQQLLWCSRESKMPGSTCCAGQCTWVPSQGVHVYLARKSSSSPSKEENLSQKTFTPYRGVVKEAAGDWFISLSQMKSVHEFPPAHLNPRESTKSSVWESMRGNMHVMPLATNAWTLWISRGEVVKQFSLFFYPPPQQMTKGREGRSYQSLEGKKTTLYMSLQVSI